MSPHFLGTPSDDHDDGGDGMTFDQPRRGFWDFNIGHVLVIVGMAASAFWVVQGVEVQLAEHEHRIATLEAAAQHASDKLDTLLAQQSSVVNTVNLLNQRLSFVALQLGVKIPATSGN